MRDGSDARGRPTQLSRTVPGGKRDAQRLAAELESSGGKAKPAGRSVGDVLDEWVKQNIDTRSLNPVDMNAPSSDDR